MPRTTRTGRDIDAASWVRRTVTGLTLLVLATATPWRPGDAAAASLLVSDAHDPGSTGDGALSLSEAIRLATGDLQVGALSGAERAQVTGTPGAASPDTIAFAVAAIALSGGTGGDVLPPLTGGGDTVDGAGAVVLDGAHTVHRQFLFGLRLASDGNVVRGLTLNDLPGSAIAVVAPDGASVTGNQIVGNHVVRPGLDAVRILAATPAAVGATTVGGRVASTLVQGNVIEAPDAVAMNVIAAYAPVAATMSGAVIEDLVIEQNLVQDVLRGLFVRAVAGHAAFSDNTIDGLVIRDNTFRRVLDLPLFVGASNVGDQGTSIGATVRGVTIARNVLATRVDSPYDGGAMFITGGLLDNCFKADGTSTSHGDVTSGVEIVDNEIRDTRPFGIYLQGGQACGGAGGVLTASGLRDVRVRGNVVDHSVTGISIVGVSTYDTGAGVENRDNEVRDVTVADNTVTNNESAGLELISAYVGVRDGRSGTTSDNRIAGVTLSGNTLTGNKHGVAVNGAIATGRATAAGNTIEGLRITGNTIADGAGTGVTIQTVAAPRGATMGDNRIVAPEITDNVISRVREVGIAVGAGIADVGSVGGSKLEGMVVARNTITDVVGGNNRSTGFGVLLNGQSSRGTLGPVRFEQNTIRRASLYGLSLFRTTGHTLVRNDVTECGRGAFFGKKRKNTLIENTFGKRVRRAKRR